MFVESTKNEHIEKIMSESLDLGYYVFSLIIGLICLIAHLSIGLNGLEYAYFVYAGLIVFGLLGIENDRKSKKL